MSLAEEIYKEACDYLETAATAEVEKMEPAERELHESYLEYYKNIKKEIETAQKGGREEKRTEVAKRFIKNGMSTELIMKSTGLRQKEVEDLRPKKKK